ncbi:metal ABC transporter substrate-binding protein [Stackebrandtia endophytica]|nr:metal ABC transporter substrate-binding protein [Stackebrandtia endophytica]
MKIPQARWGGIAALTLAATSLAACGSDSAADADVSAVAAFYPLQFVTEQVGGEHVAVTNLTAAGAEPHDLELAPLQVAEITDADLVVYLPGFQPAVDQAVEQQAPDAGFDVTTATQLRESGDEHDHGDHDGHDHDHGDLDPHVWLDPTKYADIAIAVGDKLSELDPDHADDYAANAQAMADRLDELDQSYQTGLAECDTRDIVTSHAAFGYLADRYDLHEVAVTGLSPDTTPTPEAFQQVTDYVTEHGVTTIFYETLVSPSVAETIAQETGAQTAVLDPLEGLSPDSDGDYFSIMETNLSTLVTALGCT